VNNNSICFDKYYNPYLTNFSSSFHYCPNINNHNYFKELYSNYLPNELSKPIELHLLSYLLYYNLESLSLNNINTVLEDVLIHPIFHAGKDTFYLHGNNYFKKWIGKSIDYLIEDIEKYYKSWDNYSLSIFFLQLCNDYQNDIKKTDKNNILLNYQNILYNALYFNPTLRPKLDENISYIYLILETNTTTNTDIHLYK
jgi:hypothetical protein